MRIVSPKALPPAPPHLSAATKKFWAALVETYIFEPADLLRLTVACDAMDEIAACREAIKKDGRFVADRVGGVKSHPAIVAGRDARQLLLRSLRELSIDVELPAEARISRQSRRYG